jgi:hypothetical protein
MTTRITMKTDFARFEKLLGTIQKEVLPYATAAALTDCAVAAKAAVVGSMGSTFDRPTPWTENGLVVVAASARNLSATVRVKDIQAGYLLLEETGGTRDPSMRSNKASRALIVPVVKNMALNRYGNIPSGFVKRILNAAPARDLAAPQTARKLKRAAERAARDQAFFYLKGNGLGGRGPGGIFQRLPNHQARRLLSFVETEHFQPRFGYRARVSATAKQVFAEAMKKRLIEARRRFR